MAFIILALWKKRETLVKTKFDAKIFLTSPLTSCIAFSADLKKSNNSGEKWLVNTNYIFNS